MKGRALMKLGEKICSKVLRLQMDPLEISNLKVEEEGRVRFKVTREYLLSNDAKLIQLTRNVAELYRLDPFYVDTIGEVIVRKNLASFLPLLSDLSVKDYNESLSMFNHLHFSLQKCGSHIEFSFHISLLHDMILDKLLMQVEGV